MSKKLIDRALRMGEARKFKDYERRVARINMVEPEMELLEDHELREEADKLRERARNGESLDDLLYEAFALCREGSRRTLNMRHFDVQMIGGMVLHDGCIAENRSMTSCTRRLRSVGRRPAARSTCAISTCR